MIDKIKAMGDMPLVLADKDGNHVQVPLTLNELIEYIHETGACPSRHLNASERGNVVESNNQ